MQNKDASKWTINQNPGLLISSSVLLSGFAESNALGDLAGEVLDHSVIVSLFTSRELSKRLNLLNTLRAKMNARGEEFASVLNTASSIQTRGRAHKEEILQDAKRE